MNFDDLDDLLDDNSYVPSFAKREPSKPSLSAKKVNNNQSERSFDTSEVPKPPSRGLLGLHQEAAKTKPMGFEDLLKGQTEQKQTRSLEKNTSLKNLDSKKNNDKDEMNPIFPNQRGGMRRPLSRGGQQFSIEKDESDTLSVPKRMMPPLSKKNIVKKDDDFASNDHRSENFALSPPVNRQQKTKKQLLNPLDDLAKEENMQIKRAFEKQIEFQKASMQKIIEEERESRRIQIEKLKKLNEEEMAKKIELKDYEISKLKEFYEMQLSIKSNQDRESKDLSQINKNIERNLSELHKLEGKISDQYSSFQQKQSTEANWELRRKQTNLKKQQQDLQQLQKRLESFEKEFKNDKERFYAEKDRERNSLDEQVMRVNKRESELESKYRRKEKDLIDEYDRKRMDLDREKERIRNDNIESQEKKNVLINQQKELKNKMESFQEKQRTLLEEYHQQKAQVMEKEIQLSSKMNELSMKESQLEMERQELINKMKILELEKKKLEVEAKGKYEKGILTNTIGMNGRYEVPQRDAVSRLNKTSAGSNFEKYNRTISEMRDQMMKSMPKF